MKKRMNDRPADSRLRNERLLHFTEQSSVEEVARLLDSSARAADSARRKRSPPQKASAPEERARHNLTTLRHDEHDVLSTHWPNTDTLASRKPR
jgi:spore cortex formation protein SpoVR/YcgB (stage V sporulation)